VTDAFRRRGVVLPLETARSTGMVDVNGVKISSLWRQITVIAVMLIAMTVGDDRPGDGRTR